MGVVIIDGLLTLLDLVFAAIGWLTGDRQRQDAPPASGPSDRMPPNVRCS